VTLLRDAAKVWTPSSAGRSSQLTAAPVATEGALGFSSRIGERELSGAGSASEQAQFVQKHSQQSSGRLALYQLSSANKTNRISKGVRVGERDLIICKSCEAFSWNTDLLKRNALAGMAKHRDRHGQPNGVVTARIQDTGFD
jgi:hypothetical protein